MKIKNSLFMIKKLVRDLNYRPFVINKANKSTILTNYYFHFPVDISKLNRLITDFDENGVPLNSTYIDVKEKKLHYYPISIGQYGLAIWQRFIQTNSENDKRIFLSILNWFEKNGILHYSLGLIWETDVPKPEYHVFLPWKSAFSQSRAISILLRGWQLTGKKKYYDLARLALMPFLKETNSGGVAVGLLEKKTIYEEYVAKKPVRILDGAIFSLFGVYDFIRVSKNKKEFAEDNKLAVEIFNRGILGLKYWLPHYDSGFWVFYNRCEIAGYPKNDPCTIGYLKLVIKQLNILFDLTGDEFFEHYSNKWKKYLRVKNILKMYKEKFIALREMNRL